MPRRVAEDVELRPETAWIEDSVEGQQNHREGRVADAGIAVVADGDVDFSAGRLSTQLPDHSLRAVDACDPDASLVQRQRKTPGAYAELQHRTFSSSFGQACEKLHR